MKHLSRILIAILMTVCLTSPARARDSDEWIVPTSKDYPRIVKTGKSPSSFVPRGWLTVHTEEGDLNGDKHDDCALYIQGNYARFKQKHGELGTNPFDTNPKLLLILLNDPSSKNYKLAAKSTLIPIPEFPTMVEPFEEMVIKNGALKIHLSQWYSAGSWSRIDTTFTFRLRGNEFDLIGLDSTDMLRNSGEEHTCSYNFLTHKVKITNASPDENGNLKGKTHWRKIRTAKLRTLSSFEHHSTWEFMQEPNL